MSGKKGGHIQAVQAAFQGPIPPPEMMEKYNATLPGAATAWRGTRLGSAGRGPAWRGTWALQRPIRPLAQRSVSQ